MAIHSAAGDVAAADGRSFFVERAPSPPYVLDVTAAAPPPPTAAELARCADVCARFNAAPFYQLLGMQADSDAPGRARVRLPFADKLTQLYGGVHGGALLAIADAAINLAVATTFEGDERTASVQVDMQFLAPAGSSDLEAISRVERRGGRVAFGSCEIRTANAATTVVARASGVCYVVQPKP